MVPLSLRAQYDLEMLAVGAFSPLDRFMARAAVDSVFYSAPQGRRALPDPVGRALPRRSRARAPARDRFFGRQGAILALFRSQSLPRDILRECTCRSAPGQRPPSGHRGEGLADRSCRPSTVFDLPRHPLHGPRCLTPAELRARLTGMGSSTVVTFQTRNPIRRIHEELTKRALKAVGGTLLIHPAVGVTRPQDVAAPLRVDAYKVLVRNSPTRARCSR